MTRLIKEPFVHFLALGCLIFIAYGWFQHDRDDTHRIVVDQAQLDHLRELWKIQWRREPNAEETRAILERHVREEVFYREALRMGLDRNDEIIRRRLAQKMEAVADDLDALIRPPEDAKLRRFYHDNPTLFTQPAAYAFEQVLVLPDEPDRKTRQHEL